MTKSFVLKDYKNNIGDIPREPGLYYIKFSGESLEFSEENLASTKLIGINPYPVEILKDKFNATKNNNKDILYIGKADNLQSRIKQYCRYFFEHCTIHKGGRAISQIKGFENLILEYRTIENELPLCVEARELIEFKKEVGCFPVANWRI